VAGYDYWQRGSGDLLLFLGILGVNLAFLNLMPFPVLDGGHLVFLIIEKIKGSRVSRNKMIVTNMIGLAAILLLFAYVFYNDIVWIMRVYF
jgi:regulator of sigma E protease